VGPTAHTHTVVTAQGSRLVSTAIVTRSTRSSRPGGIATLCDGIAKIWLTRGTIWILAATDRSAEVATGELEDRHRGPRPSRAPRTRGARVRSISAPRRAPSEPSRA